MPNITTMAIRFSGIVAYRDNTVGVFHTSVEGTEANYVLWSIDQNTSIENLKQVSWADRANRWPWWRAVTLILSSFNFMWVDWDTELPILQKEINSMTGRFDLIATFDDNSIATAAAVGSGSVNPATNMLSDMVVVEDEAIAAADNIASVRLGVRMLLNEIMSEVSVTIHVPGPD